jgi:NAD(P)H-dependent FMN reductase
MASCSARRANGGPHPGLREKDSRSHEIVATFPAGAYRSPVAKHVLGIIIGSTRPGRAGKPIADWFTAIASKHASFETKVLDLKEINLPFLDEAEQARLKKYAHEHTKKWSTLVESCDAFVIVTAEYNYGYPAPLKNALDFVYREWNHKTCGFVSYGGASGGTRAVQQLKQVTQGLQMASPVEAVTIPMFPKHLKDGTFVSAEPLENAAHALLDALAKLTGALKTLRG